jgi:hypothetical protein
MVKNASFKATGRLQDKYPHIIARYIHCQLSARGRVVYDYVAIIRQTVQKLAEHLIVNGDPTELDRLTWVACACRASFHGRKIIEQSPGETAMFAESDTDANCLTLAAWLGDLELVKSLHQGSDPITFFGRPSWAAGFQGHADIVEYCLSHGARAYYRSDYPGAVFLYNDAFIGAAYNGHENVVQRYLEHWSTDEEQVLFACRSAAYGNQDKIFRMLLKHVKHTYTDKSYDFAVNFGFYHACKNDALAVAKHAFECGADMEWAVHPVIHCTTFAAYTGSAQLMKFLNDATVHAKLDVPSVMLVQARRRAKWRNYREMQLIIENWERPKQGEGKVPSAGDEVRTRHQYPPAIRR